MNEEGKTWPQYLAAVTSSLSAIGCGLHYGWPSHTLRLIRLQMLTIKLDTDDMSNILTIAPIGYVISGTFNAFFVDAFGRKLSLLLVAAPQIAAWILIANAKDKVLLYLAKIVAGVAEGALYSILPLYLGEIAHPSIRGHVGSIFTVSLLFGTFLINCYGPYVTMELCAYVSISVPVLFVISFSLMPESPYFLIMKGRIDDARSSLKRLRHLADVDEELAQLVLDVERQISEKGTLKEIVTIKANRKGLIILLIVRALQQFSGYSAFAFYSDKIFKNVSYVDSKYSAAIYAAAHMVFITAGSFLVDTLGRRRLLMISLIGVGLILFGMGTYFFCFQFYEDRMYYILWFPIAGMILYTIFFDMGLGLVPNVLTGEVLSASIKTKTLGIVIVYCSIMTAASSKLFAWFEMKYHIFVPFFMFGLCCVIGLPFVYFYTPETKGKTLEEIQQELGKR